jgi:hypothetical protein
MSTLDDGTLFRDSRIRSCFRVAEISMPPAKAVGEALRPRLSR